MKLIFLGPPGAGKGTQADKVCGYHGIAHISTGEMLRGEIREGTECGLEAKCYIEKGELVPDEVIIGMVKHRIQAQDCAKGFLLDGFPRTVAQADAFQHISDIDMVINIDVPAARLIDRIGGRRMCSGCGVGYHVSTYASDTCERCGAPLFIRDDDKPETVKNRIQVYERLTQPLIAYYEERGKLQTVNGDETPAEVTADILALTEKLL